MSDPPPSRPPRQPQTEQGVGRIVTPRFAILAAVLVLVGFLLMAELRPDRQSENGAEDVLTGDIEPADTGSTLDDASTSTPTSDTDATDTEHTVGPDGDYATAQQALDQARPGDVIRLLGPGGHRGPVTTTHAGTAEQPITLTAEPGATLTCDATVRCLEVAHPSYRILDLTIIGGSSGIYLVGGRPGDYVSDVEIRHSTIVGHPDGGTGECIRVKYQAFDVEIADNDLVDCGLGECCEDSKNGEGVYVGTAPEQLGDNPSDEPDRTHDIWIHHNTINSLTECVEAKEHVHSILVEHNTCSGQLDPTGAALGSRGGEVGRGNIFRYNVIDNAVGACVRLGGDEETDGVGNAVYGNVCRNIGGRFGFNQQRLPQGVICGNRFEGDLPGQLSNEPAVDPTTPCPDSIDLLSD